MKRKIAVIAILILIFTFTFTLFGCDTNDKGNAPGVITGDISSSGLPTLTWKAYSSPEIRIINGGLHPKTETVSLDFGYNTVEMQKQGYTTLHFNLKFKAYIDNGIYVYTNVNSYLTDGNKTNFGVNWEFNFSNTSSVTYYEDATVNIGSLQQNKGKIYLTFEAMTNSFQTGSHISNIELTITAQ